MKKMALVLGFMALGAFSFAQDFKVSVGGGVSYKSDSAYTTVDTDSIKQKINASDAKMALGLLVDFTYAVIYIDYSFAVSKVKIDDETDIFGKTTSESETNQSDLVFSIYGKYPFNILKELAIYPLIGLGYNVNLDTKDKSTLNQVAKDSLNFLFVGAGLGLDFDLTSNLFLRAQGIFNFAPDYMKKKYEDINSTATGLKVTSNGFEIKAGLNVGYKF